MAPACSHTGNEHSHSLSNTHTLTRILSHTYWDSNRLFIVKLRNTLLSGVLNWNKIQQIKLSEQRSLKINQHIATEIRALIKSVGLKKSLEEQAPRNLSSVDRARQYDITYTQSYT